MKSFLSHIGLIGSHGLCIANPQPDTSLHCETTDMGLVHHIVCPVYFQLLLVITMPTHGGMARLS